MPSDWYCFTDDEAGPYSFQQLADMIVRGELNESDLVRRGDVTNWRTVNSVPGLVRAKGGPRCGTSAKSAAASPRNAAGDWHRRINWRRVLGAPCALTILVLLVLIVVVPFRRSRRFLEPAGSNRFEGAGRLDPSRGRAPEQPTLLRPALGAPVVVPGFEGLTWLKSPSLSADLLTIVYVADVGQGALEDLFIAGRRSIDQPFINHHPIKATVTPHREAHPTLSPDGLELIYAQLGSPTRLWHTRRDDVSKQFGPPQPLEIQGLASEGKHVDAPQFLDVKTICVTVGDVEFHHREQIIARRPNRESSFEFVSLLPAPHPWPRYFVTSNAGRAYFPSEQGIMLTAFYPTSREFLTPECVLPADATGPRLTEFDDTIWIAPQEDVVFYCSPGPNANDSDDHRLWMVRF